MSNQWQSLGNVTVTDSWQLIGISVGNEVFRITASVTDSDWELKVRSGTYIKFRYETSFNSFSESKKFYIPRSNTPIIYDFPIPDELKNQGMVTRSISCILSSRYAGKFSLASFAPITLTIEESNAVGGLSDRQLLEQLIADVAELKQLIGE
jgi:hypothetical protein